MSSKPIAAISILLLVALSGVAGPTWAQKGPIKIGFLTQMTGGGAAVGKDVEWFHDEPRGGRQPNSRTKGPGDDRGYSRRPGSSAN